MKVHNLNLKVNEFFTDECFKEEAECSSEKDIEQ